MKKLLLSASLAINIVFLLLACTKENVAELKEGSFASGNKNPASLRNASARSNPATCTGPFQGMPYSLVHEMINNYRNKQQLAIEAGLGINDANMCWFDLARMKEFICHLESLVEQSGCANISGLGLRFYYGAHGNNPAAYGLPDNYAGLHNLVIIPTYRSTTGMNVDFDPSKIDPSTCAPSPLRQLGGSEKLNNIIVANNANSSAAGDIFAMNHGQLGPPDTLGTGF
jgi:hypothetical protein